MLWTYSSKYGKKSQLCGAPKERVDAKGRWLTDYVLAFHAEDVMSRPVVKSFAQYGKGFHLPAGG